uniref:G protein-coupled receptor n=1 Tax=Caenorhabditis tropicalis TaxID=1561998 RepID=A0A1I7SYA5_9PELO
MEAVQLLAQKSCAVLSFAINSLLIQLILFRSPKGIGMYKFLMVYISVFELIYAFLGLMVQPDFLSHSSVFLVIARTDRLGIPLWMIRIVNTMFRSMFGMSMAMFTLHFIYRYFVIIGETFFQKNRITIDQVTYIGPNYYTTDHNGTETFNWTVFGGMSVIITMVSISILTIVIFAYKSYKGVGVLLRESHHSDGYKTLQSQLLNMLVAQVSIPAILMHGPASFLFTGPIFHVANEFAGDFFCISVAVYPVLDPLPTMFMIQHYRQVVCRLVLKCV